MKRRDIEWVVNGNGELYLRDRADWTAENTRSIERRHEEERQRWLREHHTTYREAAE